MFPRLKVPGLALWWLVLLRPLTAQVELPPVSFDSDGDTSNRPVIRDETDQHRLKFDSLPHLVLDVHRRHLDIDATVCLHQGKLELLACTENTKEHESIIAIKAQPKNVHLLLTLLGATSGHPARREAIDETRTRWRDVPARGHPVDAYFVFKDPTGQLVEKPIQQFLKNESGQSFHTSTFLFAGSLIRDVPGGRKVYMADRSGHVITLANFGDGLLSLPQIHSHANDALAWEVEPDGLPAIGSEIVLRLRPHAPKRKPSSPPNDRSRKISPRPKASPAQRGPAPPGKPSPLDPS